MSRYKVTVSREWTESGEVAVEVDNDSPQAEKDMARGMVQEMLVSDDDLIEWWSSNMEPGQQSVEAVVKEGAT